jgi:hypothetical protein
MPDREIKQLTSDSAHTRGSAGVGGGCAVFFGALFIAGGMLLLLGGLGVIQFQKQPDVPAWVVIVMASVFAGPGVWVALSGLKELLKSRQVKRQLLQRPQEHWLADYAWDRSVAMDDSPRQFRNSVAILLFLVGFLSPFNYFVFFDEDKISWLPAIGVGLFDLFALALLWQVVYLLIRLAKYGRSYLRFERFPFFLGETLGVKFVAPRGIGRFEKMTFALRCVQERIETSCSGRGRSIQMVRYQLYGDEYVFDKPGELPAGAAELPISFNLPADTLGTALARNPPTYWELEVKAVTPGVDYGVTFLVPVYARSPNGA